jgi:integrase
MKVKKKGKRGQNEGSIFQRRMHGKERWIIQVTDTNGEPRQFYPKENTRLAAAALLEEKLALNKKGISLVDPKKTVGEYFDEWFALQLPTLRKSTLTMYEHLVRNHIKPEFGKIKLNELTRGRISLWVKNMLDGGKSATTGKPHRSLTTGRAYSRATVRHLVTLLGYALGEAVKNRQLAFNPAEDIRLPKDNQSKGLKVAVMDADEHKKFEAAARKTPYWMVFRTLDALALRRNEALALKWADFDFDAKLPNGQPCPTVSIVRSLAGMSIGETAEETEISMVAPKTDAGSRKLPLGPKLVKDLQEHQRKQIATMATNPKWQDHGLVFTTENGTPINPRNLNRAFTLLLKKAGLSHFRLHSLRHGVATEMVDKAVPMKLISDFLGHSQIGITMNFYAKSQMEGLQKAAAVTDTREAA